MDASLRCPNCRRNVQPYHKSCRYCGEKQPPRPGFWKLLILSSVICTAIGGSIGLLLGANTDFADLLPLIGGAIGGYIGAVLSEMIYKRSISKRR
jgi:hypothetical protein